MIGYYNYTVVLTYIGTLFGFLGISFIGNNHLKNALICLVIAGFCDMFDGTIASTMERTKQEKRFGIQIDSLSDLVCFGVLPALIAFRCSDGGVLQFFISAAYLLCALIRLAWFNVDEERRQDFEEEQRETYLGLPVTTSALLIPFFMSGAQLLSLSLNKLCPWVLLLVAIAFISPVPLKKINVAGKAVMILLGAAALTLVLIGVKV